MIAISKIKRVVFDRIKGKEYKGGRIVGNELTNFIKQVNQKADSLRDFMMQASIITEQYTSRAIELSNKLESTIRKFTQSPQFREGWERFSKGIIETEQDLRVFKTVMVEFGFPPHHAIGIRRMREIAKSYILDKEVVEENISDFLIEYYDFKVLNEMLLEWENSDILQKRLSLLRNAMMAHNIGMYDLVVPAFLSQLEGFLVDLFKVEGRVDGAITKVLLKHLLLENNSKNNGFNFDDSIHLYYSQQILENFEHGKEMKYGVSRHAILHGADTDFGNAKTSIKVIMLFDYLTEVSNELSVEFIKAANDEIEELRKKRMEKKEKQEEMRKYYEENVGL